MPRINPEIYRRKKEMDPRLIYLIGMGVFMLMMFAAVYFVSTEFDKMDERNRAEDDQQLQLVAKELGLPEKSVILVDETYKYSEALLSEYRTSNGVYLVQFNEDGDIKAIVEK